MIVVLRLGHRLKRDERLSTHVGLASRALGADKIIYSGVRTLKIEGRGRAPDYVYAVVKAYKEAIESILNKTYNS